MLNLLRVIDNPGIDIPLLSVLCSPMYAFTPDELAEMRCESRKSSLYSSVCEYAKTNDKARKFVDELKILRDCACTNSVDALISKACEMTGFMSISLAVSGNDSSLKNLELLREYARSLRATATKRFLILFHIPTSLLPIRQTLTHHHKMRATLQMP